MEFENNKNKKSRIIITSVLIILTISAVVLAGYYITTHSNDSKYINELSAEKEKVDKVNKAVALSIKNLDSLDVSNTQESQRIMNTVVDAEVSLEKVIDEIKLISPPAKYKSQYDLYIQGISLNRRIFTQTKLILQNTKSASLNNAVDDLYKYVSSSTQAYELSKLGKSYISLPSEILTLPDKVSQYAFKVYNDYESKNRLLEQYTSYFDSMGGIVSDFQKSKVDLGNNLTLLQNNKTDIESIYTDIEKKLNELNDIQNSYNSLTVPSKLAQHHQKFNDIIKTYTYYCNDYKSALTKLEEAGGDQEKLQEANQIFNDLQNKYNNLSKAFDNYVNEFNSNKSLYTDINNL